MDFDAISSVEVRLDLKRVWIPQVRGALIVIAITSIVNQ
jgi:hypothetical protein